MFVNRKWSKEDLQVDVVSTFLSGSISFAWILWGRQGDLAKGWWPARRDSTILGLEEDRFILTSSDLGSWLVGSD